MASESDVDVLRYAAFTTDPSGGNPAGIVLGAGRLDDGLMQKIAADVGYSETAFVVGADPVRRRYRLRYFSPQAEVAFCGHATVATAIALAERQGAGEVTFDIPPGRMSLDVTGDGDGGLRATFTSVPTHSRAATPQEWQPVINALGWAKDDLDPAYPPAIAYAGNDHLILAAISRGRLAAMSYDFDVLADHMRAHDLTTVHVIYAEDPTVFHARDPFPPGGVVEDPATGAAAAAFGGYLRDLGTPDLPADVHIVQGEDMGRRSDLWVQISKHSRVQVSGSAVPLPAPG